MEKVSRIKLSPQEIADAIGDWLLKTHKVVVMGDVDYYPAGTIGTVSVPAPRAEVDTEDKPAVKRPRKPKTGG